MTTPPDDTRLLDALQGDALRYFLDAAHPRTGLVADSTMPGTACSIAAVGMALGAYPIAVERSLLSRAEAAERTLRVLRFFHDSRQGVHPPLTEPACHGEGCRCLWCEHGPHAGVAAPLAATPEPSDC